MKRVRCKHARTGKRAKVWDALQASAILDKGKISGWGGFNRERRARRETPRVIGGPEPAMTALAGGASAAMLEAS